MSAELKARKADFRLHYCTRSKEKTAFRSACDRSSSGGTSCSIMTVAIPSEASISLLPSPSPFPVSIYTSVDQQG